MCLSVKENKVNKVNVALPVKDVSVARLYVTQSLLSDCSTL